MSELSPNATLRELVSEGRTAILAMKRDGYHDILWEKILDAIEGLSQGDVGMMASDMEKLGHADVAYTLRVLMRANIAQADQLMERASVAPTAALTEQDIKRFRVGDILFNDEQAKMFCDLAQKGLRAEALPPSGTYNEESYILSILSLISPDMHAAAEKDLRFMLAQRSSLTPSATTSAELDEDGERYRWFRNECAWFRRADIVEAAGEDAAMLDHHIDKGRCGL